MHTTRPSRYRGLLKARALLTGGVLALTATASAESQSIDPQPTATAVTFRADASTAEPPLALANGADIGPQLRRWYRSLDTHRTLGAGSVLLTLKVEPDGSVSDVDIARAGGHHPWLNGLARRAARKMTFATLPSGTGARASSGPVWVRMWIHFR